MKASIPALVLLTVSLAACSTPEREDSAPSSANSELNKGSATIRMALVAETTKGKTKHVLASSLNAQFKAAGYKMTVPGFDEFPTYVELKDQAAIQQYSALLSALNDAISAAKLDYQAYSAAGPESFQFTLNKQPVLCYNGDGHNAVDALETLVSTIFSEQVGVWGWRYKHEKHFEDADEGDFNNPDTDMGDFPDIWKEWRGQGEAVLVLTHEGDDAVDIESTILSKCPATK
jgi:hypothetical protein